MIEEIGNIIIMVVFGLLLGAMGQVIFIFERPHKKLRTRKEPGETYIHYILRISTTAVREQDNIIKKYRTAYYITIGMIYVVVGIMILLINFTYVRMNWLVFMLSLFAATMVLMVLISRVKAGKISIKSRLFDIPSEEEKP